MIEYHQNPSAFFKLNQEFCKALETEFQRYHEECFGFCDSYGYQLKSKISLYKFTFNFHFNKSQSTAGNGTFMPFRANNCAYLELTIDKILNVPNLTFGENFLERLIYRRNINLKKTKVNSKLFEIKNYLEKNEVIKMNLTNSTMYLCFNDSVKMPNEVITELTPILANLNNSH